MLDYVVAPTEDQLAAFGLLVDQAFRLPAGSWPAIRDRLDGRLRVVRREGDVAGGLALYDMGHWFGGRSVPTWGIATVCVDQAFRAQGIGHALMVESLRECAAAGVPLSTLFPSTTAFYRTVGYERAGNRFEHVMDVRRIDVRTRSLDVWPADAETLREVAGRAGSRGAGIIDRNAAMWDRVLDPRGSSPVHAYACGIDGRPEGTLVFQTAPPASQGAFGYDVHVREMWGLTPAAVQTWWAFLHDMRTMARDVRWYGPASDPRTLLLPDQAWSFGRVWQWMLRIVDLRGAISSRGWRSDGAVDLDLTDPLFKENNGRWRITVEDGVGVAERGGSGGLALDVKALAPLYSGLSTAETLADLGLVAGGSRDLAAASALFAGPEPWFQDMF